MQDAAIILGNQLFPAEELEELPVQTIFMAEDRGLCTHYRYHKHKIVLFLAAMRKYRDRLRTDGYDVHYVAADDAAFAEPYESKLAAFLEKHPDIQRLHVFEVEDKFFEDRLQAFAGEHGLELVLHQSPMFLTSRDTFSQWLGDRKRPMMRLFYEFQRKRLKILLEPDGSPVGGKWSFDADNRKKLPKSIELADPPLRRQDDLVNEVATFVETEFADHPGRAQDFLFPTDREESLLWIEHFFRERFGFFGAYQDAITPRSDFLFHSTLSPMLNLGLILPGEVVERALAVAEAAPESVPLNSLEGFIRQIIGWREFVRGIYQNYSERQWQENFWGNHRKMNSCWYDGSTGIPLLDDAILKAERCSYNHHIERLMILSNFMLLTEIDPREVYSWFMEMNCDSSDWVMGPNVFGMGQFSDGGIFATKPYICGSNYFTKMSDYKKGPWCDIADGLYWRFIEKHRSFYENNPRLGMMVRTLDKMAPDRKSRIYTAAESFIGRVTA